MEDLPTTTDNGAVQVTRDGDQAGVSEVNRTLTSNARPADAIPTPSDNAPPAFNQPPSSSPPPQTYRDVMGLASDYGSESSMNSTEREADQRRREEEDERRERELKQLAASLGDLEGKTKQQVLNLIASKKEEMLRDQDGEKPALWTDASEDDVLETLVTGSKMSWQQPMNIRDAGCCVRKGYCCFNKYHDTLQLTETNNSTMHEELSQTSHQSSNSMLSEAGSKFCCSCIGKGDEESSYREDTFPLASGQQLRRLAAIPVSGSTAPLEVQQVDVAESSSLSVPLLGAASAAVVCIGCALRRRFMQLKRRDSFGFLADSQRPSLNAAELAV